MSDENTLNEAIWIHTAEKVSEAEEILQNVAVEAPSTVENPHIDRQHQIKEFTQTALARLSDAAEQFEHDDDLHNRAQAVGQLMLSVDVFLEATQDIQANMMGTSGSVPPTIDMIGEVRDIVGRVETLMRTIEGKY